MLCQTLYQMLNFICDNVLLGYALLACIIFLASFYLTRFYIKTPKQSSSTNPSDKRAKFVLKFSATITIAVVSLILAYSQLDQIKHEIKGRTYNEMNDWYNRIYKEFPGTFEVEKEDIKKRNLARRYFNLWDSEFSHCVDSNINDSFMTRINHGACKNMVLYPELIKQYRFWQEKKAFYHTPNLRHQISIVIEYAEQDNCENIPKTKNCIIHSGEN